MKQKNLKQLSEKEFLERLEDAFSFLLFKFKKVKVTHFE